MLATCQYLRAILEQTWGDGKERRRNQVGRHRGVYAKLRSFVFRAQKTGWGGGPNEGTDPKVIPVWLGCKKGPSTFDIISIR